MIRKMLFLIIFTLILIFGTIAASPKILYKYSYVRSINTSTYGTAKIIKILEEFNDLGSGKIVKYKGLRPIKIKEAVFQEKENSDKITIGLSQIASAYCVISLSKDLHGNKLRDTLLHEYLHCFGYKHTDTPNDLMYPISGKVSYSNIVDYAKDLENKMETNTWPE